MHYEKKNLLERKKDCTAWLREMTKKSASIDMFLLLWSFAIIWHKGSYDNRTVVISDHPTITTTILRVHYGHLRSLCDVKMAWSNAWMIATDRIICESDSIICEDDR